MDFDFSLAAPQPATLDDCHQLIAQLWQHDARQQAELIKLKAQLATNSMNSSCPPSSDTPKARAERVKAREDWQKRTAAYWRKPKQGAQPGHPGYGRYLWPLEQVHTAIPCYPALCCPACGGEIKSLKLRQRKQVFDIVSGQLKVTEYQVYGGHCLQCKARCRGQLPVGAPTGMLGSTVLSYIGILVGKYRLSKREVKALLEEFFGLGISVGSVSNAEALISLSLKPSVDEVGQAIQKCSYLHVDETSHYHQGGQEWLWVATTQALSYFKIFEHRDTVSAKALIGEDYQGIAVTDRYGAYNWLPASQRQYCWAHLKRDFKKVAEREGGLGYHLLIIYRHVFDAWHAIQAGKSSSWRLLDAIKRFRRCLHEGRLLAGTKTGHLCIKLLKDWPSLWHFLRRADVEPTNNQAERQLRHAVIWRKKCFGTQAERGKRFVERILTCTLSCRQQGRSLLAFVQACVKAYWMDSAYPSLIES